MPNARIRPWPSVPPPPSPEGGTGSPAALFALLLGGFGAHKFYLGRTGMGVVFLIFCWTGIPSLVGMFEGISYLLKTDEEFERRYAG